MIPACQGLVEATFLRLDAPHSSSPLCPHSLSLSLSLCLLPCQTSCLCLLVAHWLQPLPSNFPQNSPESLPQAHTFPPELWTLPSLFSGTWRILQVYLCHQPYPLLCDLSPFQALLCGPLPFLGFLPSCPYTPLACCLCPGPLLLSFSLGSHLLLWFHSSIL